jgi:hypothetical protein
VPMVQTRALGQHVPFTQVAPVWQHWVSHGVVPAGHAAHVPLTQLPLQQSVSPEQSPPFCRHIGVVDVEVVLVDVEVVLVEVLVVLLVVLLVDVVLVDVEVVVVVHRPWRSPWAWWHSSARWETSIVFSSGVPGLWQMVTFCCWDSTREGTSAAMALPAKSLSALRLLIEPSARARARSSKECSTFVGLSEGEPPLLCSSAAIRTLSPL